MFSRLFFVALLALAALLSTEAFSIRPAFPALSPSSTSLFASRVNAKKLKIKRNRENMRKFASPGRRGTTRRKILKKAQASKARQDENEFIAKCFITGPSPNERDDE